ncbi:MAG: hypothetical protein K0U47_04765 [Epsilonproteobacteria bacterium]|nr:hypothetical protein [Campylobacterota bacterium]
MYINVKKSISILAVSIALLFQACGGGGSSDNASNDNGASTVGYKYDRISIAGSSITWGKGRMGEDSYVGIVENYFRDTVAKTIIPESDSAQVLNDPMSYKGKLYKYTGAGIEISGVIEGDEISVVFAKERGNLGANVEMIVDGESLGTFSTAGESVGSEIKTFLGNSTLKSFDLGRAHTFNHIVNIGTVTDIPNKIENGMSIDQEGEYSFGSNDWAIVRKTVGMDVHHFITFQNAPQGNFTVSYDYGENIKPVKSSVDHVGRAIGSTLESTYGDRGTALTETLAPKEGLDFRQTDARAVKSWKLSSAGTHNFTLKIKEGGSEEFIVNFITNHMYYFQNAGIGGATAADLLRNDNVRTADQIIAFQPDLFILESSTNDANTWARENEESTNDWVKVDVGFESVAANKIKLLDGAAVKSGDIVIMGDYGGDINDVAVGIVNDWDADNQIITFTNDIPTNITAICDIKRITRWETNVKNVVDRVKSGIGSTVSVGIGTSGVPNLSQRRLMGYREKGKIMADQNGWMFYDFFQKTLEVESGIDTTNQWSRGDNTHPNSAGNLLFGAAITEVLAQQ